MSRFIERDGKLWPRALFDPPLNPPPGTCRHCGGSGELIESIDEERYDVAVHCFHCRKYCEVCRDWVKIAGHACKQETK